MAHKILGAYAAADLEKRRLNAGNGKEATATTIATLDKPASEKHHAERKQQSSFDGFTPQSDIDPRTLAVAFGRFQELCRTFAVEYDLPPRMFTRRLIELISASQVR